MKGDGWHKYDHVRFSKGSSQLIIDRNIAIGLKAGMHQKQAVAKALAIRDAYLLMIEHTRNKRDSWEQDGLNELWNESVGGTW